MVWIWIAYRFQTRSVTINIKSTFPVHMTIIKQCRWRIIPAASAKRRP